MKTYSTEKHNIPDGATHYSDEGANSCFAWYKQIHSTPFIWCVGYEDEWVSMIIPEEFKRHCVKPIPQQEVEWKSGDECEIDMAEGVRRYIFGCECPNNQNTCIVFTRDGSGHMVMPIERLIKPESPEEKERRERLEAIREIEAFIISLPMSETILPMALAERIVDKTNYRKEG